MTIVHEVAAFPRLTGRVGFVPTMGALHEGHAALLRECRRHCDVLVLSIFVNPTQFGPNEDFTRYPRTWDEDLRLAEREGVDVVLAPSAEDMYAAEGISMSVGALANRWEGECRPGHFDGVATIVAKLFNIVRPDVTVFGQKDLQQCQVIDTLIRVFSYPIELVILPTIREADGLALSSRNRYLSAEDRAKAPAIYANLVAIREAIRAGIPLEDALSAARDRLVADGFSVDYLAYVDLPAMNEQSKLVDKGALVVTARRGNTRLLDNLLLESGPNP
ncbi:MAG: pantoate--beta-alanine ligase [Fimbriimonadaceae bacterium]|nr:pantoate--beta-alanine ligase [Fimbriimonadaceae bacterium]